MAVYAKCRETGVAWAKAFSLPENLVYAVLQVESSCNPKARSPLTRYGYAYGIAQILESTGRAYGLSVEDLYNPEKAIPVCAQILANDFAYFGDIYLAIAAYHAGRKAVNRYKPCLPPPSFGELITGGSSTVDYVKRVCRVAGLPFDACIAGQSSKPPQQQDNDQPEIKPGNGNSGGLGSLIGGSVLFSRKTFVVALVVLLSIFALSKIIKK